MALPIAEAAATAPVFTGCSGPRECLCLENISKKEETQLSELKLYLSLVGYCLKLQTIYDFLCLFL